MIELKVTIGGKDLAYRSELPEHFDQVSGVQSTYAHLQRTVDVLLWALAHDVGRKEKG